MEEGKTPSPTEGLPAMRRGHFVAIAGGLLAILGVVIGIVSVNTGRIDFPRVIARLRPAPTVTVCIDPGHPSPTAPGNILQHGLREVNVNWEVAKRLELILEREPGIRVVMTREARDQVMSNRERAEIANKADACLLLRLHCDSGGSRGFTIYYPDRRGWAEGVVGPSRGVIRESGRAARIIHDGMRRELRGEVRDRGIRTEADTFVGERHGVLLGSVFCDVPVVTVEMVFLSSRSDAGFIATTDGQETMARALAEGVMEFVRAREDGGG